MNRQNSKQQTRSESEYNENVDRLLTELRSQSSELERLHAIYDELETKNGLLHNEVLRLKRAQRTNVQDLARVAAVLLQISRAKGIALDPVTLDLLRRRGWLPSKTRSGTRP
ncbi:uncharacterized protein YydD (DUF2326 family) [Paenarthrobacter nicotinovorans]|uniref:hypothetical protein n=1 Tax=Micrococcaceae TaxID=1268 RepID=UPI0008766DE4|nr:MULTISPECIES: hypothetical protein [Micrococcaceae]MDR6438738.1 uncharacterized protein YydD (DUF2326 family) [Paenarthrobacter nicotinovorans]SCZ56436.1 hypothetical protein SAMN02799638_01833 [Arthrobacter sp. UNCCL28]